MYTTKFLYRTLPSCQHFTTRFSTFKSVLPFLIVNKDGKEKRIVVEFYLVVI